MQLFEPAETFETNLAQRDPSLQRVGENPPYDSSEDEYTNKTIAKASEESGLAKSLVSEEGHNR